MASPPGVLSSIPRGDLVITQLPPYATQPWLGMGVVLLSGICAAAGLRARVVRPVERLESVPEPVFEASCYTLLRDPPMAARMAAMEAAAATCAPWFDALVDALAGDERVVALSLYRNNADVSLWVARRLKARAPERLVVLGGPEVLEEPEAYQQPWVDVVVGFDADRVIVPLMEALLAGHFARAAALPGVWLNPRFGAPPRTAPGDDAPAAALARPPRPRVDYHGLLKLVVGDRPATIPLLLNLGCPYNCAFCSSRNLYGRFERGDVDEVLAEVARIVEAWQALGAPSELVVQFSDATTNAVPAQFMALLRGLAARWPERRARVTFRGQMLFDESRMGEEIARAMGAAGFTSAFFGLDAATDDQRRSLGKPGTIASVARAVEAYQRAGPGELFYGLPVGMPGETRERFAKAAEFIEWSLRLPRPVTGITVLPYVFFLQSQDPAFVARNAGERRGVLWRMDDPAGDPAERARRLMTLFEVIDERAQATTAFPPYVMLPMMLPAASEAPAVAAWIARFGRHHDQLGEAAPARDTGREAPLSSAMSDEALEAALRREPYAGGWRVERVEWSSTGAPRGLVLHFARDDDGRRFALQVQPADAARRCFRRTREFNVSYLTSARGGACVFDAALMDACLARVVALEAGSART